MMSIMEMSYPLPVQRFLKGTLLLLQATYYKIQPPDGAPTVNVYCDMDGKRCNSRGSAKIAEFDVENDS